MNLKQIFNFKYLYQNLKKSKAFLCVFIGLVPIITLLMMIGYGTSDNLYIPQLEELSIINYPCMYILPIIIAICLNGHVFKKKTVDFINSMPISRKTLFFTNVLGGIILLVLMNLINAILIYISSLIFPNIIIPINMLVDYFIIFSITYIFVFTIATLAISVTGNMISSIILTILIMFFIPFVSSYLDLKKDMVSNNYEIVCNSSNCMNELNKLSIDEDDRNIKIYDLNSKSDYTIPYGLIYSILNNSDDIKLYNKTVLIKMLILSIIYIAIGYILYKNRKMEVSETSFKNINVHNIIKCLTMTPLVVFFYEGINEEPDIILWLICLVVIVAYYFIYDLITRRGIHKLKISIITLVIFLILSFSLLSINSYVLSNRHNVIKNTDVESVKINLNNFDYYYNFSSFLSDVEIKDKDLIDSLLLRSIDSYSCNKYNDYNISYDLKLKNSKTASIGTCIDEDYEKEFMTKIKSNIQVLSKFNNISYKNLYAPSINGMLLDDEVINIIKKSMANKSINSNNIKYLEHERAIYLHSYVNHEYKLYNFNYEMSDELKEIITKQENNLLKEIIDNLDIYHFYIHSDIFSKYENIYNLVYDDIEKFIKNDIKNEIDINKEYVTITLHNDSKTYKYNTNNINGLINLLESKYNEIKNIEEYSYLFDGENLYD